MFYFHNLTTKSAIEFEGYVLIASTVYCATYCAYLAHSAARRAVTVTHGHRGTVTVAVTDSASASASTTKRAKLTNCK